MIAVVEQYSKNLEVHEALVKEELKKINFLYVQQRKLKRYQ